MNLRELGQRIRSRRETCGLKQHDVSAALQVSPQAVSKWERGENAPDIGLMVPLGRLLGVTVDWLLGGFAEDRDVFEATVLASGVRGAREKSESMEPRAFAAWTNGVCYTVTEAVTARGGVPIKFVGPGILSFFSGSDHRRRAAQSALDARAATAESLKVGLSTGRIYFGAVGHPEYAQRDIMGEAVSIALLATDWAAEHTASGIAACRATVEGLGDVAAVGRARRVTFAGIHHKVALCEVDTPHRRGG